MRTIHYGVPRTRGRVRVPSRLFAPSVVFEEIPRKGMNSSNSWYMADLDQDCENTLLVAAGTEWVRFQIEWDDVEGTDNVYYWTTYDEAILNATSAGLKVLICVVNTPAWARSGGDVRTPPTLDSSYADICAVMADRWDGTGGQGLVEAVQVWNEPNNGTRFWTGTEAKYTSMAIAAYDAVKAVRSDVKVGTCVASLGIANYLTFLQALYTNGIEGKQDFVGVHLYTIGGTPTGDAQFLRLDDYIAELATQGDPAEIWVTEFGWNTSDKVYDGAGIWQSGVTEAQQAAFLGEAWTIFAARPKVTQAFWYMARDYDFGDFIESHFGVMEVAATSAAVPPFGTLKAAYDTWMGLPGGGFLRGISEGAGTTTGTLTVPAAAEIAGVTAGAGTTSGVLTAPAVAGALGDATLGAGTLGDPLGGTPASVQGTSTGAGTTSGALTAPTGLSGTSAGTGVTAGALTATALLIGATVGAGSATATLVTAAVLTGATAGAGTATGDLTAVPKLAGSVTGAGTTTATLVVAAQYAGTVTGAGTTTGVLSAVPQLSGTTTGVGSTAGGITVPGGAIVSGVAVGAGATTGALTVSIRLTGSATGSSSTSVVLSTPIRLTGASVGAGALNGAVTVPGITLRLGRPGTGGLEPLHQTGVVEHANRLVFA